MGRILILLFITIISIAFSLTGNDDFDMARREVLLRRIGHEVLLEAGDSTSRVLPIARIGDNEYQISFEKPFTFHPEVLVKTTQRLLAKDPLASDYVVNVVNCANASVAYGYAISKNKKDDIVACIGRKQPVACYTINIRFKPTGMAAAKPVYLLGGLFSLAFMGFFVLRSVKRRSALPGSMSADTDPPVGKRPPAANDIATNDDHQHDDIFSLGSMVFYVGGRKLMINGATVELTKTETRVLHIFASSPNEAIERSRLQKEIWEDEGVIVGRSLDMFISKLRKKLEPDPNIKIAVIRGKGYKLEISA